MWNMDVQMIYAGSSFFVGLGLEDGHVPTFLLLLYIGAWNPEGYNSGQQFVTMRALLGAQTTNKNKRILEHMVSAIYHSLFGP